MEILYFRLAERVIVAVCVPILLYIGFRLFESGATGKMNLTAKADGRFAKLTNLSPGALCFVLGATLGAFIMFGEIRLETPEGGTFSGFGGTYQTLRPSEGLGRVQKSERGGADDSGRLSDVIEGAYSEIGLEVQELVLRPTATIEQVQDIVTSTVSNNGLKKTVTRSSLEQIKQLESGTIDDPEALSKWREIFLGTGE